MVFPLKYILASGWANWPEWCGESTTLKTNNGAEKNEGEIKISAMTIRTESQI